MKDDSSEGYADMLVNPERFDTPLGRWNLFEVGLKYPQVKSPIFCYPCFN